MALLKKGKETKEEKTERKEQELLSRYGIENMSDPIDLESVKRIAAQLTGTGLMDLGMKLSLGAKVEDQLQARFDRLAKALEEIPR